MFTHNKTKKNVYSVREKINHYKAILNGKKKYPVTKEYAEMRLKQLTALNKRPFDEPTMIVTDDKHFGNEGSKPRACVVVGQDIKQRLKVCPVHDRKVKTLILDNDPTRQVDYDYALIDRSDVYELKNIQGLLPLTENDKRKLREIHSKK